MDGDLSFIVQTRYEVRLRKSSLLPDERTEFFNQQDREPV